MREDVKVAVVLVVVVISAALLYFSYSGPGPTINVARLTSLYGADSLIGPEVPPQDRMPAEPEPATQQHATRDAISPPITARDVGPMITYVVKPGDTLSALAVRYLGSERHLDRLLAVNPGVDPRRLRPGQKILIPQSPPTRPAAPKPPADKSQPQPQFREYRVGPGESFSSIANKLYGDSKLWERLYELNRDKVRGDPRRLQAGQVITVPTTKPTRSP